MINFLGSIMCLRNHARDLATDPDKFAGPRHQRMRFKPMMLPSRQSETDFPRRTVVSRPLCGARAFPPLRFSTWSRLEHGAPALGGPAKTGEFFLQALRAPLGGNDFVIVEK